jgi:hypothetical protein
MDAMVGGASFTKTKLLPSMGKEVTNFKNTPSGLRIAQKIIEDALPKSGLVNNSLGKN